MGAGWKIRGIATTSVRYSLAMTENFGAKPLNNNFPYKPIPVIAPKKTFQL